MGVDHRLPAVELLPDRREGSVPQVLVLVACHETDALRLERIQGVADFLERSLGIEKRQGREAREAALVVARELRAVFVREARDPAAFSTSPLTALGWMSESTDTAIPLLSMSSSDISGDHLKVEPARRPPTSSR